MRPRLSRQQQVGVARQPQESWCRWWDSNPHDFLRSRDFKSRASAISPHRLYLRPLPFHTRKKWAERCGRRPTLASEGRGILHREPPTCVPVLRQPAEAPVDEPPRRHPEHEHHHKTVPHLAPRPVARGFVGECFSGLFRGGGRGRSGRWGKCRDVQGEFLLGHFEVLGIAAAECHDTAIHSKVRPRRPLHTQRTKGQPRDEAEGHEVPAVHRYMPM